MKEIVFATANKHKIEEIAAIMPKGIAVIGMQELGFTGDIAETEDTLQGNASLKSHFIYEKFGKDCFSDDTGLEIEALGGEPGVYSARYAGADCSFDKNIDKVLQKMGNTINRKAAFRTVISLIMAGKEYFFEGKVEGTILIERHGTGGFGYDPIFKPNGFDCSFAEMSLADKNKISHRGLAVEKLIHFLSTNQSI